MSSYWQHNQPIKCPTGHEMLWLGGPWWICSSCRVIYAEVKR